jgi:hypothetical protein
LKFFGFQRNSKKTLDDLSLKIVCIYAKRKIIFFSPLLAGNQNRHGDKILVKNTQKNREITEKEATKTKKITIIQKTRDFYFNPLKTAHRGRNYEDKILHTKGQITRVFSEFPLEKEKTEKNREKQRKTEKKKNEKHLSA